MTPILKGLPFARDLSAAKNLGCTGDRKCVQARCVLAKTIAVLLLFFGFVDALTTESTLLIGGAYESNPIVCWTRCEFGAFWILPKMIGHGFLAWLTVRHPTMTMLVTMSALTVVLSVVTSENYALLGDAVGLYTREVARLTL